MKVPSCACGGGTKNGDAPLRALVYPCSGGSDVGEVSDRAARRLDAEDKAWMSCLAGISARVSGIIASAKSGAPLVAINGCPTDCATKTLALAGVTGVQSVRVTDLGFEKGKTHAADEAAAVVARHVETLLARA